MALTVSDILDSDEPVQPVRLMSYGPIEGEHTRATNFGPQGNALGPYDVAVSPDTGFSHGDILDVGDGIYRRAADASYFTPGRPTSHTIELRDKHDQGSGYAKRVTVNDILGAEPAPSPAAQAIPSPTLSQEVGPPQPITPSATDARTQHLIDSSHIGSQRDLEDIAASLPGYRQSQEAASQYDTRDKITRAIGDNLAPLVENPQNIPGDILRGVGEDVLRAVQHPSEYLGPTITSGKFSPPDLTQQQNLDELVGYILNGVPLVHGFRGLKPKAIEEAAKPEAQPPPLPEAAPAAPVAGTEDFARVAQPAESATVSAQDEFKPPNEPRSIDQTVEQPTGQEQPISERPASVGDTGQQEAVTEAGQPIGVAERYAEEELGQGSVIPGTRQDADYWRGRGRDYINSGGDPRMPIRSAMGGFSSPRGVGIVSAEYERLTQLRRQAADTLEQDPRSPQANQDFTAADTAARTWRQEMQPVLTRAGESLGAAIGERPVDLGTFDGLHEAAVEANGGNPITIAQKADLMQRSGKARQYRQAEAQATAARDQVIDRTLPKVKTPSETELSSMLNDMHKRMTPCQ